MFRKNMVKGYSYRPFRLRKAFPLRIGAVAHQRQYALLSDFSEPLQINRIAKHRCIIHLKVTRMDHNACRRVNGKRGRILNTVVGFNKLNPEMSQIDRLSVSDFFSSGTPQKIMLRKLPLNDTHCQFSSIDRKIHLPKHIGQCPDVVLMPMGDHTSFYFSDILFQIRYIRDHKFGAKHVVLR